MAQFVFVQWLVKFFINRDFEFDWDQGNRFKSILKHDVGNEESGEVFFDPNLLILGEQISPESSEERYGIIGESFEENIIFVNFTFRNLKEREYYAKNKR